MYAAGQCPSDEQNSNQDDMDLYAYTPEGTTLYFSNKQDTYGNKLDTDANAATAVTDPVEIFSTSRTGTYNIYINDNLHRSNENVPVRITIKYGGCKADEVHMQTDTNIECAHPDDCMCMTRL